MQPSGCDTVGGVPVLDDELSQVFAALADPTRRAILERLALGDATVNELAEPFAMTQQAISKHLKVLEHARLITRTRSCSVAAVRPRHGASRRCRRVDRPAPAGSGLTAMIASTSTWPPLKAKRGGGTDT